MGFYLPNIAAGRRELSDFIEMPSQPILSFVIPCYNEQAVFPHSLGELLATLQDRISEGTISEKSYLFFVDDGSQDRTWTLIEQAHAENPKCVRGIKLSRNVGHQNALLAFFLAQIGKADAVIS